jgi:hypothetical protein
MHKQKAAGRASSPALQPPAASIPPTPQSHNPLPQGLTSPGPLCCNFNVCITHTIETAIQTKDQPELSLPAPAACQELGDTLCCIHSINPNPTTPQSSFLDPYKHYILIPLLFN